MNRIKYIILFLGLLITDEAVFSQKLKRENEVPFGIKVEIIDKSNNSIFKNAKVMVNGKEFPFNIVREFYPVRAKIGDELVVTHPGFEAVYYTIKAREPIRIEIEELVTEPQYSLKKRSDAILLSLFRKNLDSAVYYKSKDFEKSSGFIENILKVNYSNRKKAIAYRMLGDIYFYWKQFDLAASTYKISLEFDDSEITKYEIAVAYILLNKYDDAEKALLSINTKKFGTYYTIMVSEKLGDIYLAKKQFKKAIQSYNDALSIAEEKKVTPKITDLNSKVGDVFAAEGRIAEANSKFKNSLDLAAKEDPVRFIEEEEKVANYFNQTQQFDKEIDLRKQTLLQTRLLNDSTLIFSDGLERIELESTNLSSRTLEKNMEINLNKVPEYFNPQTINYKIGRALVQKEEYKKAIPFLETSVKNANSSKDLVVEKDATRKLSEAYSFVGEYDKALSSYKDYVALVDSVYIRKEQEIEQAKRFAQKIVDNQRRITSLEKDRELTSSKINLAVKDQQLTEERNKNQQVIIYALIGGMGLMFVLAFLLLRSNKQQKLSNNLLALKSMRSQMNPHFIFNALNSVNSFIAENDERNANRYLSEFSVLMRSVLENSDEDFIPFSKEIELLELYVKLEHNRFKDKFTYTISVDASIDTDEYSIPPMLLQPYIENAIWHGLRYKKEVGKLDINVRKIDKETISVIIQDDGVGRKRSMELKTKNQLKQKSKGMSTIKRRIEILNDMYQDTIDVQVTDLFKDGRGTKVELTLKRR